ncbi:MAG: hypothetical protein KF894_21675 [Labilithrix sp.]|nr:hypothetical protein [Labilithrix sp.]
MKASRLKPFGAPGAVSCGLLAGLGSLVSGCSADGTISAARETSTEAPVPAPVAATGDAGSADAASCDDCELFLPACEARSFCPVAEAHIEAPVILSDLTGTSATDVWASGAKGTLLHYDGAAWSRVKGPDVSLAQIMSRAETDVWTASMLSQIFIRPARVEDEWTTARLVPLLHDADVHGMWAGNGAMWTWMAVRSYSAETTLNITRVRKSATAYRFEAPFHCGGSCNPVQRLPFMDVHGSSKDELWAVGQMGTVLRISEADADRPRAEAYDSRTYATLHGVWAGGPDDAWAVGSGGTIRHYSGSPDHRFEIVGSPVATTLRAIAGSSKSDVWAVGDGGVIVHYDGAAWSRVPLGAVPGRPDLYAVWAASPTQVWVAGDSVLLELSVAGATTGGGP